MDAAGTAETDEILRDLRASEARYRALVLTTTQMVWRTAPDGTVLHNTEAWERSTGQTQEQSNGWGWLEAVHPDDRPGTVAVWSQCLSRATVYEHRYRIQVEGQWRWILARAVPVRDEDGRVIEWVGTTVDVHDAHEAEAERERLVEDLRAALRRVTVLQGLTAALVAAADQDTVVSRLVAFLLEHVGANTVAVFLPERGGLRLVAHHGYPDWAPPVFAHTPHDAPVPIARAVAERRVVTITAADLPDEGVVRRIVDETGNRVMTALPLRAGGAVAGALALGFAEGDDLQPATVALLEAISGQVALAFQRVAGAERLSEIAVELQQQLSRTVVPQMAGVDVAVEYRPGGDAVELVGGDWYDVVPLDEDRLLVVVGDVMGRGVSAATTMASVRAALRAFAMVDPEPSAVLVRLDEYAARHCPEQFITVFCGLLDVRQRVLTWVSAGHVPPLLHRDGRCAASDGAVQPPLTLAVGRRAPEVLALRDGDVLVVVTDGVVETRHDDVEAGIAQACAVLTGDVPDSRTAVDRVAALADGSDDDVTVLALRLA